LRGEAAFTLIELLVAIVILSGGLLALATLQFQSAALTRDTKAREGATNLAREAVETIVATSYSGVEPDTVVAVLKSKPSLAPDPAYSDWTVLRRDIPYGLSVSGCYVDDPADGGGDHEGSFCNDSEEGSADTEPIDYKRFGVTVSWTGKGGIQRSVTQTTLLVPKGGAKVPSITSLTSGQGITITDPSVSSVGFTATTSSRATGVAWSLDGGIRGLASGSGTSWSFEWNISSLPDGQYVVGAQAYNSSGTYGKTSSLTITLNRTLPSAPQGFVAGWNPYNSKVDTEWLASPDQDTVGYTVYRRQTSPTSGSTTKVNCGTVADPVYIVTDTECTDASPILPSATTFVSASSGWAQGASSLTIGRPAGVSAGHLLIATFAIQSKPGVNIPAGWTLIREAFGSSNYELATFYRVAGASEPASYSFSLKSGTADLRGGVSAYSGANTGGPIDNEGANTGSSGNASSPDLSANNNGAMVINTVLFNSTNPGATITPDPSLAERYDVNPQNFSHNSADGIQATAGSTGVKVAVPSGSNSGWISQLITLKPGGGGTGTVSVNYWVVAIDRGALGALREGPASNVVNAYAPNQRPQPISGSITCTGNGDGSKTLTWGQPAQPGDPDSGDRISFDRIYRNGARYDRTGLGTESTYTDPAPGGTRTYHLTTVDTHLAESTPSASVTC
jgi:prepilin-type N-terminal cleavage/methylation domain-containing protein